MELCLNFFIRNYRTDRYDLMCSITSNDKQKPTYVDGESSAGSIEIYNNETTAALKLLDATLNFIDFWIRHFQHNY